jgi:hypothetical protein
MTTGISTKIPSDAILSNARQLKRRADRLQSLVTPPGFGDLVAGCCLVCAHSTPDVIPRFTLIRINRFSIAFSVVLAAMSSTWSC